MRRMLQVLSWISLAATILPSILFLTGDLPLERSKWILLLATIGWFVVTPLWMGRDVTRPDAKVIP